MPLMASRDTLSFNGQLKSLLSPAVLFLVYPRLSRRFYIAGAIEESSAYPSHLYGQSTYASSRVIKSEHRLSGLINRGRREIIERKWTNGKKLRWQVTRARLGDAIKTDTTLSWPLYSQEITRNYSRFTLRTHMKIIKGECADKLSRKMNTKVVQIGL